MHLCGSCAHTLTHSQPYPPPTFLPQDDRGAALGSTRAFKFQEDLSLNLHLMHVFPGVAPRASASAAASVTPAESATPAGPTPAQRLVSCSLKELQAMTPSRLMTWSEKRAGAALLGDAVARIDALEGKMATRCALTPAETEEYAALSREALEEKARWLAAEGKAQVAAALLTGEEFRVILEEMGERLAGLRTEAGAGGGSSKAALAAAAKAAELEAKREALKAASANPLLPPLRGEAEARALRSKLAALDRLEKAKAGTLLTLAEARELGARGDHAARLAAILADARGWFESDAAWDIRLKAFMAAPIGKGGPGGGKGKGR